MLFIINEVEESLTFFTVQLTTQTDLFNSNEKIIPVNYTIIYFLILY